jgi:hypothetical protein
MSEAYDLPGVTTPSAYASAAERDHEREQPADPGTAPRADTGIDPSGVAGNERPPEPLGVALGETGNADVDAAVERLRDADELPVHAHVEVYEDVHRGLRSALTALDENRG